VNPAGTRRRPVSLGGDARLESDGRGCSTQHDIRYLGFAR
jgi:hypothetical protein